MKKVISILLSIGLVMGMTCGVMADNNTTDTGATHNDGTNPGTAEVLTTTAQPEAGTVDGTSVTESPAPAEMPSSTINPTVAPTPTPTPELKKSFFYAMKNGSTLAFSEGGDKQLKYNASRTKQGKVVKPLIMDGVTYLPFRYIFESVLGYEDIGQLDNFYDISATLKGNQFAYCFPSEGNIEIAYRENDSSPVIVCASNSQDKDSVVVYGNNVTKQTVILDANSGFTMMAIRYFMNNGNLAYVDWQGETGTIFLSDSKAHTDIWRNNIYTYSDNYLTYTDITNIQGNTVSLSSVLNENAYSVNKIGKYCLYFNSDRKLCFFDITNNEHGRLMIEGYEDASISQLVIHNGQIYGIRTLEDGYTGELFEAVLSTNDDGSLYVSQYVGITGDNERVRQFLVLNMDGRVYLYFTDNNDQLTLKRIRAAGGESEYVTNDNERIDSVDGFSICGNHIVYYNFSEKTLYGANIDKVVLSNRIVYENADTDLKEVKSILTDNSGVNSSVYYIVKYNSQEDDYIKKIDFKGSSSSLIAQNTKYKHMAILNDKLYVKNIDNEIVELTK